MKYVVIAIAVIIVFLLLLILANDLYGKITVVDSVKRTACMSLVSSGCASPNSISIDNFDADGNGIIDGEDDLQDLCDNYFGTSGNVEDCKAICECETQSISPPPPPGE